MTTDADVPETDRRAWVGLAVLALPALLVTMDLSVLFLAVPALSRDLRPSSAELLWITDIYGFIIAGSLLAMGTLGDRIGRRRLLMIGGYAFAGTSAVAAFSVSAGMLIAARGLLGLAGATLAPSSLSLIRSLFPDERRRATAIGIWMSCFAAGAAVGPLVGGVLLEFFWWGSVFVLNVPVMACMVLAAPRVLPESRDPRPGRLDVVGLLLSMVALLSVVYAVKRNVELGIDLTGVLAAAGGLLVGMLFLRRQRVGDAPILDLRLLRAAAIRVSLAAMVLATAVMAGMLLFVAQYLQLVRGMSPFEAGVWSTPAMVGAIGGSLLAPRLASRVRASTMLVVSLVVAAAGLAALAAISTGVALAALVGGSLLMGLGAGAIGTVATDLILATAPPARAGSASGLSETAGELGGALGIALLGSIGLAIYRAHVAKAFPAGLDRDVAETVRSTLGGAAALADDLPASVFLAAQGAYVDGFGAAALAASVVVALTATAAAVSFRRIER